MNARYLQWFSELYDKGYDDVFRYLTIMLNKRGRKELDAEVIECVQETYILVWEKRDVLINHANVDAWIRKTAINILNNRISAANTRAKHTAFSLDKEFAEGSESVINRIDLVQPPPSETGEELLAQIKDELGNEMYAFLIGYYDKDHPINSLMEKYGLTKSGIKMRVKRALDRIKKAKL